MSAYQIDTVLTADIASGSSIAFTFQPGFDAAQFDGQAKIQYDFGDAYAVDSAYARVTPTGIRIFNASGATWQAGRPLRVIMDAKDLPDYRKNQRSSRTMLFGDSMVEREWLDNSTAQDKVGYGWLNHANLLSGQGWDVVYNYGLTGRVTGEAVALLPEIVPLARSCGFVIVSIGTNDIYADLRSADYIINRQQMIFDQLLDTGATVIALHMTPRTYVDATKLMTQYKVNDFLQNFQARNPGFFHFDASPAIIDPTSTQGAPASNVLLSGSAVHFSNYGAHLVGRKFNTDFGALVRPTSRLASSSADAHAIDSNSYQAWRNPLMLVAGGTAGTKTATGGGTSPTGTVPDYMQVDHVVAGTGACACTWIPRSDGLGNDLQLIISGAAANDRWTVRNAVNLTASGLSPGDLVQCEAEIIVDSHTNLAALPLFLQFQVDGGSTLQGNDMRNDTNNITYAQTFTGGKYKTRPIRIPPGSALTAMQWRVEPRFVTASGAATIRIGRVSIRNLTRAGFD